MKNAFKNAFRLLCCPITIRSMTVCLLPVAILFSSLLLNALCNASLIDRVVAYVDDRAITESEFRARYEILRQEAPGITEDEALNSMINALLLLQKARLMRLEASTEDNLIKEYVDVNIRSRIVVKEDKILEYYNNNRKEFGDRELTSVRGEIEKYLLELETNTQLKEHLRQLRKGANIVIQLKDK